MLPIRRAALRVLSSPSVYSLRSRQSSTFSLSALRIPRPQSSSIVFQRRWASNEAEKEELPISKLQPTPQEEVENALTEDSTVPATNASEAPPIAETANATEATEEAVPEAMPGTFNDPTNKPTTRSSRTPFRTRSDTVAPKSTIYIGNLFFDVTEDDLTKEVSKFGKVVSTKLIRDARGLSKGFGYVEFENPEQAAQAIEGLNQNLYEGRRVTVQYATRDSSTHREPGSAFSAPRNPPSSTLFIGNMSWEMTDRDLNNLFRGIKNVVDVRVAIDRRTGQPRGFAHADFVDVKSAMEAYKLLQNKETYGRKLKLDYSFPNASPRNVARDHGRQQQQEESYRE